MAENTQATDAQTEPSAPAPAPDAGQPPAKSNDTQAGGGEGEGEDEPQSVSLSDAIEELERGGTPRKAKDGGEAASEEGEEGEGKDLEADGGDGTTPEDVEVEYEGVAFKIPKAAEGAFLRAEDYGKKSTELEDRSTKLTETEERVRQFAESAQENIVEHAQVAAIDMQLADYQNVDWDALQADDPQEYLKHQRHEMNLRHQREQLVGAIAAKSQERAKEMEARRGEIEKATSAELARTIPNWGPGTQKDLTTAAASNGLSPKRVEAALKMDPEGPALLRILHKAWKYDQLVTKSRSANQKTQAATPAAKVSGRRTSSHSAEPTDKDSPEEWARKREKQLASKGKR